MRTFVRPTSQAENKGNQAQQQSIKTAEFQKQNKFVNHNSERQINQFNGRQPNRPVIRNPRRQKSAIFGRLAFFKLFLFSRHGQISFTVVTPGRLRMRLKKSWSAKAKPPASSMRTSQSLLSGLIYILFLPFLSLERMAFKPGNALASFNSISRPLATSANA